MTNQESSGVSPRESPGFIRGEKVNTFLAVIGALSLASCTALLVWAWLCGRARQRHEAEVFAALCEAVERHPAGNRFAFRARPCGHRLYASTLDVLDMEHAELTHIQTCPIAQQVPNQRDEAA